MYVEFMVHCTLYTVQFTMQISYICNPLNCKFCTGNAGLDVALYCIFLIQVLHISQQLTRMQNINSERELKEKLKSSFYLK